MITVKQATLATPKNIRDNINTCHSVQVTKALLDVDTDGPYEELHANVQCTDGVRKIRVKVYGLKSNPSEGKLWATCTCPFFMFNCEVALHHHGSSDIIHSNGAPPRVKNPGMKPWLCKHILLTLAQLKGIRGRIKFKESKLYKSYQAGIKRK